MRQVLLDTGLLVAWLDYNDAYHAWVTSYWTRISGSIEIMAARSFPSSFRTPCERACFAYPPGPNLTSAKDFFFGCRVSAISGSNGPPAVSRVRASSRRVVTPSWRFFASLRLGGQASVKQPSLDSHGRAST